MENRVKGQRKDFWRLDSCAIWQTVTFTDGEAHISLFRQKFKDNLECSVELGRAAATQTIY